jgi:DNA-binding transcriptional LysR family regulator
MSRLTFAQLEAFYWVATLGSVQGAARRLNLAQPSVSLRLRDLASHVGRPLFEPEGRGLRITDEGQALLPRAAAILEEVAAIRGHPESEEIGGVIRVGFAEGFAVVCLSQVLDALRSDHPALRPELFVSTSAVLERSLVTHQLDLAFLVNPAGTEGFRLVPLGIQPTSWFAAPKWGLQSPVRPFDLRNIPIVTNPPPSAMYRQIVDWFTAARIEPERLDICTSVSVVAHLIATGAAIGVLPNKMVEVQFAEHKPLILDSIPAVEGGHIYACFRGASPNRAADAVVRAVRRALATMDYLAPYPH